jgi:hypothetical protein
MQKLFLMKAESAFKNGGKTEVRAFVTPLHNKLLGSLCQIKTKPKNVH